MAIGGILVRDTDGTVTQTGPGMSTQVLTSNGAGALPTFQAAGGSTGALVLITEIVTSGSASTVTFSSIPNTYRDLEVRVRGRGNVAATSVILRIQFNGDMGANYDYSKADFQGGAGAGGSGGQAQGQTSADFGYLCGSTAPASNAAGCSLMVFDYKGTTFRKTGRSIGTLITANSNNNEFTTNGMILWANTAAITSVVISLSSSTFVNNSVVSLYGSL